MLSILLVSGSANEDSVFYHNWWTTVFATGFIGLKLFNSCTKHLISTVKLTSSKDAVFDILRVNELWCMTIIFSAYLERNVLIDIFCYAPQITQCFMPEITPGLRIMKHVRKNFPDDETVFQLHVSDVGRPRAYLASHYIAVRYFGGRPVVTHSTVIYLPETTRNQLN